MLLMLCVIGGVVPAARHAVTLGGSAIDDVPRAQWYRSDELLDQRAPAANGMAFAAAASW